MADRDPVRIWVQVILGISVGTLAAGSASALGILHVSLTIYHWLAIFAVVWIVNFIAVRRGWNVFILTAALAGGILAFLSYHFLCGEPIR